VTATAFLLSALAGRPEALPTDREGLPIPLLAEGAPIPGVLG
jgi:hypothetical protein